MGTTSRQFTAELWGFSWPPDELTKRCANPSGGSKPSPRERARVGAPGAAQGGRFVEIELVLASRREGMFGGQIGDKSRERGGKRGRREGALPAWLVNWIGRGFRSASFSSPVETSFKCFYQARQRLSEMAGFNAFFGASSIAAFNP